MHDIADRIADTALQSGHEPRDYSCTLLAALVDSTHAAFVQIGDGAIVVSHGEEDGWSFVFWPQHGEYVQTMNSFDRLNLDNLMAFEVAPRRPCEFAAISDGIENIVRQKAEPAVHEGFFRDKMRPVRASAAIGIDEELRDGLTPISHVGSDLRANDDDKTLILATRAGEEHATR